MGTSNSGENRDGSALGETALRVLSKLIAAVDDGLF
jgi:hypothetical protein